MAALITNAQLASRLRTTEAALVAADATQACQNASGLVRAIGRQQFSFVSQETVELDGGDQILVLLERPLVVGVADPLTVVELGQFGNQDVPLVENVDYVRLGNELRRGLNTWTSRLQGWPNRPVRGVWAPRVRVTYSHGYTVIPDDVVSVCLDVAVSLYSNPTGLRQFSIDDYSETRATEILGAASVDSIRNTLSSTGRRKAAFTIRPF